MKNEKLRAYGNTIDRKGGGVVCSEITWLLFSIIRLIIHSFWISRTAIAADVILFYCEIIQSADLSIIISIIYSIYSLIQWYFNKINNYSKMHYYKYNESTNRTECVKRTELRGGEENQPQQFLVRATFSSFSRPSHLEILVFLEKTIF